MPVAVVSSLAISRSTAASGPGRLDSIKTEDLKEWLTYIASDELEGRATFSAGLGLAAAYIEDHLRAWGVKPAGDHGSYLQTVRVLGVKTTSRSTVTVQVGGETRTFKDGEGVTFPKNMGGKRRCTVDRVEFVGYGLDVPAANHQDLPARTSGAPRSSGSGAAEDRRISTGSSTGRCSCIAIATP